MNQNLILSYNLKYQDRFKENTELITEHKNEKEDVLVFTLFSREHVLSQDVLDISDLLLYSF